MRLFRKCLSRQLYLSILIVSLCFPAISTAEELESGPSIGAMVGDLVFARPLLFAVTAVGTALYVVSLPATLLMGNAEEAGEAMVLTPAAATFTRCLGCTNKDSYENSYDDLDYSAYESKNGKKKQRFYLKGGYQSSTYFGKKNASGFNVSLGGKLIENDYAFVDLELNYHDFGNAEDDISFEDGSRNKYSENLTSLGLGTNLGIRIGDYVRIYVKGGVSKWDITSDATFFEPGESTSSSTSALNGQDTYYGAGIGFNLSKNINLDIEYLDMTLSEMDFGDNEDKLENKVTSIGASLALKF